MNVASVQSIGGVLQNILSITDKAAHHIKDLMAKRQRKALGVRVTLKTKGCSGMAYALEYVDNVPEKDTCVQEKDICLYVDPAAVLFLVGTEMDFDDNPLQPGFVFNNPNEKGRCGCGQSFHV